MNTGVLSNGRARTPDFFTCAHFYLNWKRYWISIVHAHKGLNLLLILFALLLIKFAVEIDTVGKRFRILQPDVL